MKMIKFSNLLDNLLLNPSRKKKIKILLDYFHDLDNEEKGYAFSVLSGKFSVKFIKAKDIKQMIKAKVSDELFSYSYDYVGDLAETISLLWPKAEKKKSIPLNFFIKKIISFSEKDSLLKFIEDTFNHISSNEIYAIIKFLTGGLRVGVSNGILKECLVELGKRNKFEIEEYWYGFSFPFKKFFKWLNGDKPLK